MSAGQAVAESAPGTSLAVPQSFTLASSGAWCWFGDPRAVHNRGLHRRTFVGYITSAGDIRVTQYDHDTAQTVTSTLMSGFQVDDHNNPSILIRHDGRVVVFWSGHLGPTMYYRRSVAVEDISAGWESVKSLPTNTAGNNGYTYSNPVELSTEQNRLYLFWRGGNLNPSWSTTNGGDVWTTARTLITAPGQRPYVKVASNDVDTIHFAFTDGHPRNVQTSIYHMYYRAGSLYRSDGTRIGPVTTAVTPAGDSIAELPGEPNYSGASRSTTRTRRWSSCRVRSAASTRSNGGRRRTAARAGARSPSPPTRSTRRCARSSRTA